MNRRRNQYLNNISFVTKGQFEKGGCLVSCKNQAF